MQKSTLRAIPTREQAGVKDKQRNTLSMGYVYSLSKRSDLYGVVVADRVTDLESGTGAAAGFRHRF
jgi:predicted porin